MTPIRAPSTEPMMDQFLVRSALVLSFSWLSLTAAENKANLSLSEPSAASYAVRRRRSSCGGKRKRGNFINLGSGGGKKSPCLVCLMQTFKNRPGGVCAPVWPAPGSGPPPWRLCPACLWSPSAWPEGPPGQHEPHAPSPWPPWTPPQPAENTRVQDVGGSRVCVSGASFGFSGSADLSDFGLGFTDLVEPNKLFISGPPGVQRGGSRLGWSLPPPLPQLTCVLEVRLEMIKPVWMSKLQELTNSDLWANCSKHLFYP